jgi:hypothetical protein
MKSGSTGGRSQRRWATRISCGLSPRGERGPRINALDREQPNGTAMDQASPQRSALRKLWAAESGIAPAAKTKVGL